MKPCKELCIKIQDGTHFSPRLGGDDFLYVTSKSIRFGYLDLSTAERISAAEHRKIFARCDTRRGDLLLTKDGANTGNAALNCIDEEISLLSSVAFLRFDPGQHDARFFLQYILSHRGQQRLQELMSGNAITRLTLQKIRNFDMPAPPVDEQRAVAAALSDVDGLIASLDRLIAKKRAIKQAAMQQLLTGKTRLPGFSGNWSTRTLHSLAEIDSDNLGASTSPLFEFRYLSLEDVERGAIRGWSEQVFRTAPSRARRRVQDGDILFATVRPNLKSHVLIPEGFGRAVCSTGFAVIRCKPNAAAPEFLFAQLFAHGIEKQVEAVLAGSNYPAINSRDVKRLMVPAPDVEEQTAIGRVLGDMDGEIAALERRRNKAKAIKQGMMQALLTGRVRLPVEAAAGGKV
jgi:type I restriction enzyme S subunit